MAASQPMARAISGMTLPAYLRRHALGVGVAILVIVTSVAYLPALRGGFVLDDDLLLQNNLVKDPGGLARMWFTTDAIDYWPLTNSVFWLEWRLWGTHSVGYHLVNLALHLAAALLLWAVLYRLTIPGAYLAALLFAVHPVNVEAVAWISQLKTVLAAVFFLLSIDCYLNADPPPRSVALPAWLRLGARAWYWLSVVAFLLAMLSKASAATLPLVLLLLDWWNRGSLTRRDLARVLPFLVLALPLVLVNVWFQGRYSHEIVRSFAERLAGAGAIPWFYLFKALWPVNLVFIYPQWDIQAGNLLWWLPLVASLAVAGVLWRFRENPADRALLLAWAFYWLASAPVLGFADVSYMKWSLVADHYQYLAIISVVALVAAGVVRVAAWSARPRDPATVVWPAVVPAALLVGVLATLTWQQARIYRDPIDVYRDTLAKNPDCYVACNNLAGLLLDTDRPQAIELCTKALQIYPDYAEAHSNLGALLVHSGRAAEALPHYERALELKPNLPEAYDNLGVLLLNEGHAEEAVAKFERAIELRPSFANAHNNLGKAYLALGKPDDALAHFERAVQLNQTLVDAQNNLGAFFVNQNRFPEAVDHFRQALRANPHSAAIHNNLGAALFRIGNSEMALQHFEEALRLDRDDPDVNYNLGKALHYAGRSQEACPPLERALQLRPDYPDADHVLGVALVRLGRTAEGIAHLEKAVQLAPEDLDVRNNLATALYGANEAPRAVEHFQFVAQHRPQEPEAHNNLGAALLIAGRTQEAADEFERAVKLKPDNVEALTSLGIAYSRLHRKDDAIATAHKAAAVARQQGNEAVAQSVERWLNDYRAETGSPAENSASPAPTAPALPPP